MHFTTLPGFTAGHLQREALSGSPTCAGSTQIAGAPLPTLQSFMGQISRTLPWHCGPASAEEGASATGDSIGGMREPKTGALFPPRFCQRGDTHCGTLQGLGVRSKKIAGIKTVNVYSVGLFVDPDATRTALKSFRGMSPERLAKDQTFFDALVAADDVEKTLHLNIAFGRVSSSQFWDAIEGQLAPPMKELGAEEDLKTFASTFDGVKFRKGLPISFCIGQDGDLTSRIDQKFAGTIYSQALCRSLLSIYLGPSPVSPDAKTSIGDGLAHLVSAEDPPTADMADLKP